MRQQEIYLKTEDLSVGYHGNVLIKDIDISLEKGKILTLIGPNGAGKSTILKSITNQLEPISGTVFIGKNDLKTLTPKELARELAVVLTDRVRSELVTSEEIVAMGRYPYTNMFGHMTEEDRQVVDDAIRRVHAEDIRKQDFSTLSDGQRQRILLARAICQEPEVMVLDEPTAYLDIRYKVELLDILRDLAKTKNMTVIMSLHEIDLAMKVSDELLLIKGDTIYASGSPETVLQDGAIEDLYGLEPGSYDLRFGSVEMKATKEKPLFFVIGGNGAGIPFYRSLQKKGLPFAAGVLYENDLDCPVAEALSSYVYKSPAFEIMKAETVKNAWECLLTCRFVIDAGASKGPLQEGNRKLIEEAEKNGIPVIKSLEMLSAVSMEEL